MTLEKDQVSEYLLKIILTSKFLSFKGELGQWFIDLKLLVEETYVLNGNIPVTFISHSMGAPMSVIFLQQQTDEWKDKYIARLMSVAGAYGGSSKTIKVFAMGDDLGAFALRASVMREAQISMPSTAFLLPFPTFWKPDEVLVKTRTRAYTFVQLEEFFNDLGYPQGWEMRKDNIKYVSNFSAPNVEIHALFGTQIKTVEV